MESNSRPFRYSFVTSVLPIRVEDRVRGELGAEVADHGPLHVVTATAHAVRGYAAGVDLVASLSAVGVDVERTQPDLVNRRLIAERGGCTRQAVALWVNGQRHQDDPFPSPFNLTLGQLWLWGGGPNSTTSRRFRRCGITCGSTRTSLTIASSTARPLPAPERSDLAFHGNSVTALPSVMS